MRSSWSRRPPATPIRSLDGSAGSIAANVVAGDFDVIVEAESTEVYDIINSVATRVRGFDDVEDTKTYMCLE